jgi:hypothetical protein
LLTLFCFGQWVSAAIWSATQKTRSQLQKPKTQNRNWAIGGIARLNSQFKAKPKGHK